MLIDKLSSIKGIGQTIEENLTSLIGGNRIFDLLIHKPTKVTKIAIQPRLFDIIDNELVIIKAKVESHQKPTSAKSPYKVICYTPTGFVNLTFFKIFPNQVKQMPLQQEVAILGVLQKKSGENYITHPDFIVPIDKIDSLPKLKITYPLKPPITNKFINSKIRNILQQIKEKTKNIDQEKYEWIDLAIKKQKKWPNFIDSFRSLHFFDDFESNKLLSDDEKFDNLQKNFHKAIERLSYDEFLAWHLSFALAKTNNKSLKKSRELKQDLVKQLIENLEFELTDAQKKSIKDINQEILSNKKMLRLLQGDVGSGKTIVAISACLQAIGTGKQCCILCPTTVLAKQHFKYFQRILQNLNIDIQILTSSTTKKQKINLVKNLQNQKTNILISTHAVLEDDVLFGDLGLAVIDEQHRFGVIQRLKLVSKGQDVDTLLMSATPIPRSLMMTFYGDIDITTIKEKPRNRKKIETAIISASKKLEIYDAIKRNLKEGNKIYWICPAIDNNKINNPEDLFAPEDENIELENVEAKYKELSQVIDPQQIAVIHGQMKDKEKDQVMQEFADPNGQTKLLIATTVIEVGIDVPDATIMIIDNAERFGLAQLHQIRGRVGRSEKQSYCLLLYGKKISQNGLQRLNILKNSNDGYYIAEEDLKIRGSGDLIGTRQSGLPDFKIADISLYLDLMQIAHQQALDIIKNDRDLSKKINNKYRYLMQLFGYDECLNLIHSG